MPPSTSSVAPVIAPASSDSRNHTAPVLNPVTIHRGHIWPERYGKADEGFLWFVERLFVLPWATISFMEKRSSDIVQESHSQE